MNNDIMHEFEDMQDSNLKITLQPQKLLKNGIVIILNGIIDSYNPIVLKKIISKLIELNYTKIIFDCTSLKHLSSMGVGAFIAFIKLVSPYDGGIILVSLNKNVYNIFHLLGFTQLFIIKNTIEEAIKLLNTSSDSKQLSEFPHVLNCPTCLGQLKINKPGRFRCTKCKTILAVDDATQLFLG